MSVKLTIPIIYLITDGKTTSHTSSSSDQYQSILELARLAVAAEIPFFQLREKQLSARVLYQLTCDAVLLTRGSNTRVLVNDRADIAKAANAHGVQLTSRSLQANVVRQLYGDDFVIGVSTHSFDEALAAKQAADFILYGPVFETLSKREYGSPQGIQNLENICAQVEELPVVAIGGVTRENARDCFNAGASGVAAISMFSDATTLQSTVAKLRRDFESL